MKHNISITLEQQIFRQVENARGREKRSSFIEHLIVIGLNNYIIKNNQQQATALVFFKATNKKKGIVG